MTKQILAAKKTNKYYTGFSSGSLLFKETDPIISNVSHAEDFIAGDELGNYRAILVNSEASQKRLLREINKRFQAIENPDFIRLYQGSNDDGKLLILFYAACKTYSMIADFMIETVLAKWYRMDYELTTYDYQNFLYQQMEKIPEIENLSPYTMQKLAQVVIRMLNELGMLQENKLQKIDFNPQLLEAIVINGDAWFLEVLLLSDVERQEIAAR